MEIPALLMIASVVVSLAIPCLPSAWANTYCRYLRKLATGLVASQLLLAVVLAAGYLASGPFRYSFSPIDATAIAPFELAIYFDGITCLMLSMVCFVGTVVSQYSVRYLDGEPNQGRYYQWLVFTIGAVSLFVISGNLGLSFAAWVATSLGLHQLLTHYSERPAARRAAWTKFAISRIGDALLLAALVLTWESFGSWDLETIFAKASALSASTVTTGEMTIGWLFMLGAVTKSAQFPFHVWLPETMETPTPVSALMHAGIVNAGGFLVIRLNPLIALTPSALTVLALVGGFTAIFAALVMMTQPSIKRGLAYSTIAQMGFMMLQCGLGAFAAAMLHIVAHSLYKAHAFLSSGSAIEEARSVAGAKTAALSAKLQYLYLGGAALATLAAFATISQLSGMGVISKPGGLLLAFVFCLAVITWGQRVMTFPKGQAISTALLGTAGLCLTYSMGYLLVAWMIGPAVASVETSSVVGAVPFLIVAGFTALFFIQLQAVKKDPPAWVNALRVHAVNGFYVEALYYRLFASATRD